MVSTGGLPGNAGGMTVGCRFCHRCKFISYGVVRRLGSGLFSLLVMNIDVHMRRRGQVRMQASL